MRSKRRRAAACLVSALLVFLVPAQASAQTTYDIQIGAPFFEMEPPIPGFSLRIYPSSIRVHQGDVLHFFGFGAPILHREGEHPEEWIERNRVTIGDPFFDLVSDPDEGPDALKFNPIFEQPTADCTDQANPCEWDGSGELLNPGFIEEAWVRITADPGSVIYATFAENSYLRIEVVGQDQAASTQDELDDRARQMLRKDHDTLLALHNKFSTRQSSHTTPRGTRVWDAWAGIDRGPLGLNAMYPETLSIKRGDRVRWHFDLDFNVHTVTMPFRKGVEIIRSYDSTEFGLVCDPDGDEGTAPDTPPTGQSEEDPPCPDPSQVEFDINPREVHPAGNGVFTGRSDFEHSGVKARTTLQPGFFNEDPFTVKFKETSSRRGFRYLCTIHGPFMSGRVIVRR